MSFNFFVERSIILCPYLGGSTIGGSTVLTNCSTFLPMHMYTKTSVTVHVLRRYKHLANWASNAPYAHRQAQ